MAAQTPIRGMGLMEARRSLLHQLDELDFFEKGLPASHHIDSLHDDEVVDLTDRLIVLHANIMMTAEHIEELKAKEQ